MSKELCLYIPPVVSLPDINYYLSLQHNPYQYSFDTQVMDLRLIDFSDAYSILKFSYSLQQEYVSNPYLYRITKKNEFGENQNSILLLGTYHILPIEVYPQQLVSLMLGCKRFVMECVDLPQESQDDEENYLYQIPEKSLEPQNKQQICYDGWFEELPPQLQQYLAYFIPPTCEAALENPGTAATEYQGQHQQCSMDHDLLNFFVQYELPVLGLETAEENQNENISLIQNYTRKRALQEFTEEFSNMMRKGGLLMTYLEDTLAYLQGTMQPDNDPYVAERNHNWFPKLIKIIKESHTYEEEGDNSTLVAVGLDHLLGESGLLNLFEQSGNYEITRFFCTQAGKVYETHDYSD